MMHYQIYATAFMGGCLGMMVMMFGLGTSKRHELAMYTGMAIGCVSVLVMIVCFLIQVWSYDAN